MKIPRICLSCFAEDSSGDTFLHNAGCSYLTELRRTTRALQTYDFEMDSQDFADEYGRCFLCDAEVDRGVCDDNTLWWYCSACKGDSSLEEDPGPQIDPPSCPDDDDDSPVSDEDQTNYDVMEGESFAVSDDSSMTGNVLTDLSDAIRDTARLIANHIRGVWIKELCTYPHQEAFFDSMTPADLDRVRMNASMGSAADSARAWAGGYDSGECPACDMHARPVNRCAAHQQSYQSELNKRDFVPKPSWQCFVPACIYARTGADYCSEHKGLPSKPSSRHMAGYIECSVCLHPAQEHNDDGQCEREDDEGFLCFCDDYEYDGMEPKVEDDSEPCCVGYNLGAYGRVCPHCDNIGTRLVTRDCAICGHGIVWHNDVSGCTFKGEALCHCECHQYAAPDDDEEFIRHSPTCPDGEDCLLHPVYQKGCGAELDAKCQAPVCYCSNYDCASTGRRHPNLADWIQGTDTITIRRDDHVRTDTGPVDLYMGGLKILHGMKAGNVFKVLIKGVRLMYSYDDSKGLVFKPQVNPRPHSIHCPDFPRALYEPMSWVGSLNCTCPSHSIMRCARDVYCVPCRQLDRADDIPHAAEQREYVDKTWHTVARYASGLRMIDARKQKVEFHPLYIPFAQGQCYRCGNNIFHTYGCKSIEPTKRRIEFLKANGVAQDEIDFNETYPNITFQNTLDSTPEDTPCVSCGHNRENHSIVGTYGCTFMDFGFFCPCTRYESRS